MGLSHEGRRIQDSLTPCYDLYDILYNQSVLRQPHFDNSFKMEEIIYERKNIVNYRKKQQN